MTFALFFAIVFAFVNCISTVPNEVQNYVEKAISSERQLHKLAQFAIEWAHNNGLILRTQQRIGRSDVAEFAPVSLLPSPFPREAFEKAIAAQKAMQLLYFRVARDFDFLFDAYQEVVNTDDHIRQMVDILREVQRQGIKQPTTMLLMRADYMLNRVKSKNEKEIDHYDIRQIEVNSGAIGGMGIDHRTTELHRQMLRRVGMDTANAPQNDGHLNLAQSLVMAWRAFGNSDALLIILCHEAFRYKFELRNLECDLDRLSEGKLRVEYVSLSAGYRDLTLAKDFSLLLNGEIVGVVYSLISALGYVPNKEMDELQMEVRKRIELSTAIKAPSLAIAISCSKKIQQLLALPGKVERFFPSPEEADKVRIIRETFAGLWGLENDDEETEWIINDAIENPSNYVLKPNGECGGNNYYDEALAQKLRTISPEGRSTHILMQKLHPMTTKNYFLRPWFTNPKLGVVVGELGVYGTLLGNMRDGTVSHNVQSGHLLRTKLADVNEGGISVGTGVGDSPYLF